MLIATLWISGRISHGFAYEIQKKSLCRHPKPNSNSNALSILSLDDVALDYDGAIKTYTGSGTDLVIGMEGAALYASSPNALEVLLGEALAKTWANRYIKTPILCFRR